MSSSRRHKHELVSLSEGGRYKCSGCKEKGRNARFTCTKCKNVMIHQQCAQLPDVYENSIHAEGQLKFRPETFFTHNCIACRKEIEGFVFESPSRNLRFHPLCITLPLNFNFGGHINHALQLFKAGEEKYSCNFCNQSNRGWRYACQQCPYTLDLSCAKLDLQGLLHSPLKDEDVIEHGDGNDGDSTKIAIEVIKIVADLAGGGSS
ncbi:hypothetical protein SUGI_0965890 [Cryptomeria japonica]|uniref:protein VACUOLELESS GAMETOPHYTES-like n=1 Tax=Cryptomeria japonica TaxID=3369 RepID=UPI0024147A43|nr:protein VACUOLELESS GAMETOPHYTES-like [Cryptomeria japonica]GLJ45879.1 hypothetical protein SUGI_0965890 [Cryptomeria japonica]